MDDNNNDNILLNHARTVSRKIPDILPDVKHRRIYTSLVLIDSEINVIEFLETKWKLLNISKEVADEIIENIDEYYEFLKIYEQAYEELLYEYLPFPGDYNIIANRSRQRDEWFNLSYLLSDDYVAESPYGYYNKYLFSKIKHLDNWYIFSFKLNGKSINDIFNEIDTDEEIGLIYFKTKDSDVIFKINKLYEISKDIELDYLNDKLYIHTKSYGIIVVNLDEDRDIASFELKINHSENIDEILRVFENAFNVRMYLPEISSVESEFYLFGMDFDLITFLDYLQTTKLIRYNIVLYELIKPINYETNTLLRLHINSGYDFQQEIAVVELQLGKVIGEYLTTIPIKSSEEIKYRASEFNLPDSVIKMHIRTFNIKNAYSTNAINYVRFLIARALDDYNVNYRQELLEDYRDIPFDYSPKFVFNIGIPIGDSEDVKLKYVIPNLFISNYARYGCVKNRQPKISLDDPGSKYSSNQKVEFNILDDDGTEINKVYFYCDKHKHPYIGLKENKLANKNLYDVIPCCYARMSRDVKKVSQSKNRILKTLHILQKGRIGLFNTKIGEYLYLKWNNNTNSKFKYILREGLDNSNNSIIDIICKSLNLIPEYEEIRYEMSRMHMGLLASENYNKSSQSLRKSILNNEYLDLDRFVRLYEEFFDINILIFTDDEISIPNHRNLYQSSFIQNRNTLLFYKRDKGVYELLVWSKVATDIFKKSDIIRFIDTNTYRRFINNIRLSLFETSILNINNMRKTSITSYTILKNFRSQFIDINGKVRAFNIRITRNKIRTIVTSMKLPLNLPVDYNIYYWDIDEVYSYFGNIQIMTTTLTGFYIYVNEIFFIPIRNFDTNKYPNIPMLSISPLVEMEMNIYINEEAVKEKIMRVILELSLWYFKYTNSDTIDTFINEYTQLDENIIYNIDSLVSALPKNDEGFNNLISSNFMTNDLKLIYNSKDFDIIILQFLDNYINREYKYKEITKLKSVYVNTSDYEKNVNEMLLLGRNSFDNWFNNNFNNMNIDILTEINISSMFRKLPFIYRDKEFGDFIIQNLNNPNFNNALHIANVWKNENRNLGYYNSEYDINQNVQYQTYGISKEYMLRVIKISSIKDHVKILNYFGNFYAAILPI